jgi:hypothetical protein
MIKDRYWSIENLKKTLEEDPVWLASDILSIASLWSSWAGWVSRVWSNVVGKTTSLWWKLSSFADDAGKLWRTLDVASELWVWIWIDKFWWSRFGTSTVWKILLAPSQPMAVAKTLAEGIQNTIKSRPKKLEELSSWL